MCRCVNFMFGQNTQHTHPRDTWQGLSTPTEAQPGQVSSVTVWGQPLWARERGAPSGWAWGLPPSGSSLQTGAPAAPCRSH